MKAAALHKPSAIRNASDRKTAPELGGPASKRFSPTFHRTAHFSPKKGGPDKHAKNPSSDCSLRTGGPLRLTRTVWDWGALTLTEQHSHCLPGGGHTRASKPSLGANRVSGAHFPSSVSTILLGGKKNNKLTGGRRRRRVQARSQPQGKAVCLPSASDSKPSPL